VWQAKIEIFLKQDILDPQGSAIGHILKNMGFGSVKNVRMGKNVLLTFDDSLSLEEVKTQTDEICRKLLANPVIEEYRFEIVPADQAGDIRK
jgi:phosphoribosylformylglycinamidine synthase